MNRPFLGTTWDRLKRESAFRVGTLYAGVSWFMIEAADTLGASPGAIRRFALLLAVVFLVLVPAVWYYDRRRARAAHQPAAPPLVPLPPLFVRPAHTRRWATTVAAFCVIALGMWGFRTRVAGDAVPAAATHLAVLPFHATGSDEVRELGLGMVDLLTAALNDVGGIRTVPGRTVVAALDGLGVVALERALEVGDRLGAGSVLTGSITAFGAQVRLVAEIRTVADGYVLASAEVQGAQDEVLRLTDELTLALLRDMWRTRAPIPTVRVAGLMTTSPQALKAYLRGEEHMRGLRFDSAGEYFRAATAADSTFALAWLRLAENAGWQSGATEAIEERRTYTARALAHADRLPERERSFVRAINLAQLGAFAAFDSLDAYVRRYPDDPVGWYELGDIRYHAGYLGLFEKDEIIRPFLESTRLDPAFGLGLHHVLDITLRQGDSASFHNALQSYARVGPQDRVDGFRRQAAIRFAPNDRILAEFSGAIRKLHPVEHRSPIGLLVGAMGSVTRIDVDIDPRLYFMALDTLRRVHGDDRYYERRATELRMYSFGALGMVDSMFAELDRFSRLPGGSPPPVPAPLMRPLRRVWAALDGAAPLDAVAADVALLEPESESFAVRNTLHEYFVRRGDIERARRIGSEMRLPPGLRAVDTLALKQSYDGWMRLVYGDTIGGIADLDAGMQRLGFVDTSYLGFPWFHYAQVLTRIPERRQQGIRMLRWVAENWASNTGDSYLALGRALEAEGERQQARAAYAQVLRLWAHADAFRHAERAEAKAALERLAVER